MIYVYNRTKEDHSNHPNNYPCYRGGSILANPYTHLDLEKTKAIYKAKSREDSIVKYDTYFDVMYSGNIQFKSMVDEIYNKYKNGEDIYLECYCSPLPCHCDIIKSKLEKRLLKEKIRNIKEKKS